MKKFTEIIEDIKKVRTAIAEAEAKEKMLIDSYINLEV